MRATDLRMKLTRGAKRASPGALRTPVADGRRARSATAPRRRRGTAGQGGIARRDRGQRSRSWRGTSGTTRSGAHTCWPGSWVGGSRPRSGALSSKGTARRSGHRCVTATSRSTSTTVDRFPRTSTSWSRSRGRSTRTRSTCPSLACRRSASGSWRRWHATGRWYSTSTTTNSHFSASTTGFLRETCSGFGAITT